MILSLHVLNEDATLNNFINIGSARAVKGSTAKLMLQLIQPDKKIRYIPSATSVITMDFVNSDTSQILKTASFPFVDDRSIVEFDLSSMDTVGIISQNLIVKITDAAPITPGVNEAQSLALVATGGGTNVPATGSFTLTFASYTTAPIIASNVTAGAIQAALQALGSIGFNNITVSGPTNGPFTITFVNALGNAPQPMITATVNLLADSGASHINVVLGESVLGVLPVYANVIIAILQGGLQMVPLTQSC